jgi:hypothetical protein
MSSRTRTPINSVRLFNDVSINTLQSRVTSPSDLKPVSEVNKNEQKKMFEISFVVCILWSADITQTESALKHTRF